MEAKKPHQLATSSQTRDVSVDGVKVMDFFGNVKTEFGKINWTSPEKLKVYTKIVVGTAFFLGMGIYVVDLFIQSFIAGLSFFMRLLGG